MVEHAPPGNWTVDFNGTIITVNKDQKFIVEGAIHAINDITHVVGANAQIFGPLPATDIGEKKVRLHVVDLE
jgi:hypothetical protein